MQIVVIGGGASGMAAAIAAKTADPASRVLILEKKERVGKKILATGNGRCNLTNRDLSLCHFHGSCAVLVPAVFAEMGPEETESFWNGLGIEYRELEEGKVFPYSLQASSVLDALRFELERLGVELLTDAKVQSIVRKAKGFELSVLCEEKTRTLRADRVILAAGGAASPKLGSAGEGAKLAKGLGLAVSELRPALCRLLSRDPELRNLAGVKQEGRAALWNGEKEIAREDGEILFTQEGLSGPPILRLSRAAGDLLAEEKKAEIRLDLFPEYAQGVLFAKLTERFGRLSHLSAQDAFGGFVHKKVAVSALKRAGIAPGSPAAGLGKKEAGALAALLKGFAFSVTAPDGFEEAQVTAGGVLANELTPGLGSRKVPGLFLCGEVLDLDGDCGGYNLQWAVSSGIVAGRNAAAAE